MDVFWTLIALGAIALLGALVFAVYKHFSASEAGTTTAVEQAPERSDYSQELLSINLEVRKAAIASPLMASCERLIDQLLELAPKLEGGAAAGSELNWTVKRIATEYLPNKCVRPFLSLSTEQQAKPEAADSFRTNLGALSKELDAVADMLSRKDMQSYQQKSEFLNKRFNIEGDA